MPVSRAVSKLYFAALQLLEALDEAGMHMLDELVLQEPELEAVEELRRAVRAYQEEIGNGSNDNH